MEATWYVSTAAVAPNDRPITVEMARTQCRLPDESQDEYLALLIDGATQQVQTTGQVLLCPQTIRAQWDAIPCGDAWIRLPIGPVRNSVTLEYVDPTSGSWTTLSTRQQWTDGQMLHLAPAAGESWPSAKPLVAPSVRATYDAGFASVSAIPAALREAVLMLTKFYFESPDGMSRGNGVEIPLAIRQKIASASRRGYP